MAQKKVNCWEYMKCRREPGGEKAELMGTCPAAGDASYDGINLGTNAGRFCWAVAGTMCGGKVQGSFAEKRGSCISCPFFRRVQKEQGTDSSRRKFLSFFSGNGHNPFLKNMTYKHVNAGERILTQGENGDEAYIIQRGSCMIIVEKDGELHPAGHRGVGDIIGEMTLLTGEPRSAHVEAETDMELWVLDRKLFENISKDNPELLEFLTEIVTDRLDSKRPVPDRQISKYVATDIIGRGGYSIVYKGIHSGLNMPVTIKMMRHDMALHDEFQANFRNEAKTIASLNHENIVKIYDIEERFRTIFIIEEYVEGESLKNLLKRLKTLTPALAVDFLIQVCSGLDYAHQRGIIHRDINPTNIFVQPNDRLKILDFGLACPIGTEDLEFYGTAGYMSPEQIDGDTVDPRTDLYALGMTAYEMVTGKTPFPKDHIPTLMEMHLNENIPDPAKVVPGLPEPLRKFIMKAGRCRPFERYQSVSQALEELYPLTKGLGLSNNDLFVEKRKMATLFLIYGNEHDLALSRLVDEFSEKAKKLGVILKAADLQDL